jgi:hypothetical protein
MTGPSAEQHRKDDTRRKIIAGAVLLNHAATDPAFAAELIALLNLRVTDQRDRALFDFLTDRQPD